MAVLVVLLFGALEAWDAAERRVAAVEPKAARAEFLLEKRKAELSKAYALSQEQYKAFEGLSRERGP